MNYPRYAARDAEIRQMDADGADIAVIAHEFGMTTNAVRLVLSRARKAGDRPPATRGPNITMTLTDDIMADLNRIAADRFVSHRELACQIVHVAIKRGLVGMILDARP